MTELDEVHKRNLSRSEEEENESPYDWNEFQYGKISALWPFLNTIDSSGDGCLFDPFSGGFTSFERNFWGATLDHQVLLFAVGPDGILSAPYDGIEGAMRDGTIQEKVRYSSWVYSPTNGMESGGDIFRYERF